MSEAKEKDAKDVDEGTGEPTEADWLFEYIESVMKSPAWDSEVMGFVDDNCMVFDNEEVSPRIAQKCTSRFLKSSIHA
jgi:hypothetical protein